MAGSTNPILQSEPSIGQVSNKAQRKAPSVLSKSWGLLYSFSNIVQGIGYAETPAVDPSLAAGGTHVPVESADLDGSQTYMFGKRQSIIHNQMKMSLPHATIIRMILFKLNESKKIEEQEHSFFSHQS